MHCFCKSRRGLLSVQITIRRNMHYALFLQKEGRGAERAGQILYQGDRDPPAASRDARLVVRMMIIVVMKMIFFFMVVLITLLVKMMMIIIVMKMIIFCIMVIITFYLLSSP